MNSAVILFPLHIYFYKILPFHRNIDAHREKNTPHRGLSVSNTRICKHEPAQTHCKQMETRAYRCLRWILTSSVRLSLKVR